MYGISVPEKISNGGTIVKLPVNINNKRETASYCYHGAISRLLSAHLMIVTLLIQLLFSPCSELLII